MMGGILVELVQGNCSRDDRRRLDEGHRDLVQGSMGVGHTGVVARTGVAGGSRRMDCRRRAGWVVCGE